MHGGQACQTASLHALIKVSELVNMKDYKIVFNVSTEALQTEVKALLEEGWIPLGGVSMGVCTLYQAMALPEKRMPVPKNGN
jgi:hypothetical protein